MATEIKDLLDSIPGVKPDWKEDWKDDTKKDWIVDWGAVPGGSPAAAPVFTVAPVISGTAQVGETLTVSTGTVTGNPVPTISYQWTFDGVDVNGETSNSYVVQSSNVGLMVGVIVTATNSEGTATEEVVVGPVVS